MLGRTIRTLALMGAVGCGGLLGLGRLMANVFSWNVGMGTFGSSGSWTPSGGPPVAGDTAQFNLATTPTVMFATSPVNGPLSVTAGNVIFSASGAARVYTTLNATIQGGNLTLTGTLPTLQLATGSMFVAGGSTLTVNQGNSVSASSLGVGTLMPASTAAVVVDGAGSAVTVSGSTALGLGGDTGTLVLQNGATGTFADITTVGSGGAGGGATILVQGAAGVTAGGNLGFGVGSGTGQSSSVTVTGAGSTFVQTGGTAITLGSATVGDTAAMNINTSGVFTTGTGPLTINKSGTLTMAGGILNANGNITLTGGKMVSMAIGASAFNWAPGKTMTIQAGGQMSLAGDVPITTGSTIVVTGAGSSLATSNFGRLYVNGGNQLAISAGGVVDIAGTLNTGTNGSGTITVDGAGSSLTVRDGQGAGTGLGGSSPASIMFTNGATGNFLSTLLIPSTGGNTGTLGVLSGSHVSANNMYLDGPASSGNGTVTVSGSGSALSVAGQLVIGGGSAGTASLTVTGASLTTGTPVAIAGAAAYGSGPVFLNLGGSLTITNSAAVLGSISMGGGTLTFNSGTLGFAGALEVGTAGLLGSTVNLDATRSLTASGATTIDAGATLTLSGGTLATDAIINNGSFNFSSGHLILLSQSIYIGAGGFFGANYSVTAGKTLGLNGTTTVSAGSALTIAGGELDAGHLNIAGSVVVESGTLAPTNLAISSSGRLTIDADEVVSASTSASNAGRIELGGGGAYLGGGGSLVNSGVITGSGEIAMPLASSSGSQILAASGDHLLFSAGVSGPLLGAVNLVGGIVEFTPAIAIGSAGVVTGRGTFMATGGVTNGGQFQLSGGTMDMYGALTNASGGRISVTGGSTTTFYNALSLNAGSSLNVATGSYAVFFGNVTGTSTISGGGTMDFEGGSSSVASAVAVSFVAVQDAAVVSAQSYQAAQLTVNGLASIAPSGGPLGTSKVGALSIAGSMNHWTGTLDMNNNMMIVQGGGAAVRNVVENQIAYARDGGAWDRPGITSSSARAAHLASGFDSLTLGVILNSDLATPYTSFGGQPVSPGDVLIKFTYGGDANLNGVVNGDDYFQIDQGFVNHLTGWINGDFNHDGVVNGDDYFIIDSEFINQSGQLAAGEALAHEAEFGPSYLSGFTAGQLAAIGVPEPTSLALLGLAGVGMLNRRRQRVGPRRLRRRA